MIEIRKLVRYKTALRVPDFYKDHIGAQAYSTRVSYETLQYRHRTFIGTDDNWSEWKDVETVHEFKDETSDLHTVAMTIF